MTNLRSVMPENGLHAYHFVIYQIERHFNQYGMITARSRPFKQIRIVAYSVVYHMLIYRSLQTANNLLLL